MDVYKLLFTEMENEITITVLRVQERIHLELVEFKFLVRDISFLLCLAVLCFPRVSLLLKQKLWPLGKCYF